MKSLPGTDSVWMREFEPALMRELEDLMKIVPHCPHCGSIALQRINGLAMCDDCPWTGSDHDAGYMVLG
jgi:ribosomal protein L37AE/L43A